MPGFIPLYDLSQFKDLISIPLPTIIKAKDDFDYYGIDSNLEDLIVQYPQIRLATFDVYKQTDISMELKIPHVPAFLLYKGDEKMHEISVDIPGQVEAFIAKAKELVD